MSGKASLFGKTSGGAREHQRREFLLADMCKIMSLSLPTPGSRDPLNCATQGDVRSLVQNDQGHGYGIGIKVKQGKDPKVDPQKVFRCAN